MISESYSSLELQLVRASLSTRSSEELAELLQRPVPEIIDLINELTDGCADQREQDVKIYIEERNKAKKKGRPSRNTEAIALEKKRNKESKSIDRERSNTKTEAEKAWQQQRQQYRQREDQRKYKTRVIDPSKLTTVKLDDKTWAQVEIQATPALTQQLINKTKATYEANKTLNQYNLTNN